MRRYAISLRGRTACARPRNRTSVPSRFRSPLSLQPLPKELETRPLATLPSFRITQQPEKRDTVELDFFGEPVSFLGPSTSSNTKNAMAALDGFLLTIVTKGKAAFGGGDEAGLDVKPAHAVALAWSPVLRHAAVWKAAAPMLTVTAVAPLLAHAGVAYAKHLDESLLLHAASGVPGLEGDIQLLDLARSVVQAQGVHNYSASDDDDDDDNTWDDRECLHVEALEFLLRDQPKKALSVMLKLLQLCPGDVLALSLALDLAHTVGDKTAALRAVGSVSAYWNERRGGIITPALTGHALATSWMALGFAVGGRYEDAEHLADRGIYQGKKMGGAVATWAQAQIFDAGGRVSEGISAMTNFDGISNYEGSGFAFFDCRLAGYGIRFQLDREERGRGISKALRLYEGNFDRVLNYSGFSVGQAWKRPRHPAPLPWKDATSTPALGDGQDEVDRQPSFWETVVGGEQNNPNAPKEYYELVLKGEQLPSAKLENWEPSLEDVLTWLPPTPPLLADATMLLLRFTLNGTISTQDARWEHMRNAWQVMLEIHAKDQRDLTFAPLVALSASLLFDPAETGADRIGNGRLAQGLYEMGKTLRLGGGANKESKDKSTGESSSSTTSVARTNIADTEPDFWLPVEAGDVNNVWKDICDHFASAIDGYGDLDDDNNDDKTAFAHWEFETRTFLEHAAVFAACKAGDTESLSMARAICSLGVSLRPNSPEEWWRYSIVVGLLGDQVASENALQNSINVGSGQGSRSSGSL